jgi:hypothetical protein
MLEALAEAALAPPTEFVRPGEVAALRERGRLLLDLARRAEETGLLRTLAARHAAGQVLPAPPWPLVQEPPLLDQALEALEVGVEAAQGPRPQRELTALLLTKSQRELADLLLRFVELTGATAAPDPSRAVRVISLFHRLVPVLRDPWIRGRLEARLASWLQLQGQRPPPELLAAALRDLSEVPLTEDGGPHLLARHLRWSCGAGLAETRAPGETALEPLWRSANPREALTGPPASDPRVSDKPAVLLMQVSELARVEASYRNVLERAWRAGLRPGQAGVDPALGVLWETRESKRSEVDQNADILARHSLGSPLAALTKAVAADLRLADLLNEDAQNQSALDAQRKLDRLTGDRDLEEVLAEASLPAHVAWGLGRLATHLATRTELLLEVGRRQRRETPSDPNLDRRLEELRMACDTDCSRLLFLDGLAPSLLTPGLARTLDALSQEGTAQGADEGR